METKCSLPDIRYDEEMAKLEKENLEILKLINKLKQQNNARI